jgi:glycosyltransferase involved in cell wall biosynthesis
VRIDFLILGRHMPSSRFRVLQYVPRLQAAGVDCRVIGLDPNFFIPGLRMPFSFLHRLRAIRSSRRADLVFLQKPDFVIRLRLYLRLLFRRGSKVVFDFDDAIFIDPESGRERSGPARRRLQNILEQSRLVIAGNDYLADFARRYCRDVRVIPTPIDTEIYVPRTASTGRKKITIGWMGTAPNLKYLMALRPVIRDVLAEAGVEFLVISNDEAKAAGCLVHGHAHYQNWRADHEVADLQRFDIGIMPLADDAFTRGKCGFKLLQYMAVGIPVVASPVGANLRIVSDGINGFLAAAESEWLDRLRRLCRDGELRARLGRAGRETVATRFSTRVLFPVFHDCLRQAVAEK